MKALDDALTAARRSREHRRVNAVLAGAPLAALWGPNPVPRAGGRCLDVVRLLRITTDSPAVEAMSTRCQAVLEAFRGRAAAARRMIDSARRTVTELGLRHALLEVEQFAGIVELVVDDPAAAEPHLRKAYNGFRRMSLDADIAETAALLGRACLAIGRDDEADELCTESERLAGHALKPSIAWRSLRAQLHSRENRHDEARRVAEAAVSLAERTDLLIDHGDACVVLSQVLGAAGDAAGARAAVERAVDLFERKGAAALAERARGVLGEGIRPSAPAAPEAPVAKLDNACVRAGQRVAAAIARRDCDEFEREFAPEALLETRRKTVGFSQTDIPSDEWLRQTRSLLETGVLRVNHVVIAVRGERLALARMVTASADVSPGAPHDEFLQLYGLDEEGRIALQIWFDTDDIDAAVAEMNALHARFAELKSITPLENTASRVYARVQAFFAARDLSAMAELIADEFCSDDRRRVVNAGARRGSAAAIEDALANAGLGVREVTATEVATRGERLALRRARYSGSAERSEAFRVDVLLVIEINADEQLAALVTFDPDDFNAAIEELGRRYLAGQAAAHAHTWSVIERTYAGFNRHELPPTTPDWVNVDHRRGRSIALGDTNAYLRATWDLAPDLNIYIEAVECLNDIGAVLTHAAHGTSRGGFDAEWRETTVLTVEGDLINHSEVFDETDLETAITTFERLSRPAPRLENAASRAIERLLNYFAARNFNAMADKFADGYCLDDRRRVVNTGKRQGGHTAIEDLRAAADLGLTSVAATVLATRGEHLVLTRACWSGRDARLQAYRLEALQLIEVDVDERILAFVVFDLDDFEAAIAELETRYLAGEAAVHAHTWSVITQSFAALNRREAPRTTPGWVNIDHRRGTSIAPGEMTELLDTTRNLTSQLDNFIVSVHRLNDLGAVVTHAAHETSQEGFHAEWRAVSLLTIGGHLVSRCEVFDEADLDAAIATFEQLSRPAQLLENTASRVDKRLLAHFASRDWNAMADLLAADLHSDDRRRVVNAGVQQGRDAQIDNFRCGADLGVTHATSTTIATRGDRLSLARVRYSHSEEASEPIHVDVLEVIEIDTDMRISAFITFDIDDFDAAVNELDARYVAGEATAYARTWSVVAEGYAAVNRRELPPTTTNWVNVDHRQGTAFAPGELTSYIRAAWDLEQAVRVYIEAVHALSDVGAVLTFVTNGTSHDGFDGEWRNVEMLTIDGQRTSRFEIFDESDIASALTRFAELQGPVRRLETAASQVAQRFLADVAAGDWDAVAARLAEDFVQNDRRRVVGAGIRQGRDAEMADLRAITDLSITGVTSTVMATRGDSLVLLRVGFSFRGQGPEAFLADVLGVAETDADERIVAAVAFDAHDYDGAFAELDTRYLAGEAAACGHSWSVITRCFAALNRREPLPTTQNWVNIDHRRGIATAPGDLTAYIRTAWDILSDGGIYVETAYRLSNFGGLVTWWGYGISQEGSDVEFRGVSLLTIEGDLVNRCEVFDDQDLEAAIEKFDELSRAARRFTSAATRVIERYAACFSAHDWTAMADLLAEDVLADDRRHVVNAGIRRGRAVNIADARAAVEVGAVSISATVFATRGERLALARVHSSNRGLLPGEIGAQMLGLLEIDADDRMAAHVIFDLDDTEAAFEELDARYLAGEAAPHVHTWSLVMSAYAALNRHELPAATTDWVNIDHRRVVAVEDGDLGRSLHAIWELAPHAAIHVETVHRLTAEGAVITHVVNATSREGLEAEWRDVSLLMFKGDRITRCEVFDEADLDTALAKFDGPQPRPQQPANAASRVDDHFFAYAEARNWPAIAEILTDGVVVDDRRRVVNAGIWDGRDAVIANMRAMAEYGATMTITDIATRGERLALRHSRFSAGDQRPEGFPIEALSVVEIDNAERILTIVTFDVDNIDAAYEELDARYLAGQAAPYANTWSVVVRECAAFNRHEITAADWLTIDRRQLVTIDGSDWRAFILAVWDLTPNLRIHIASVDRLCSFGAVVTYTASGTSPAGLAVEWRIILLLIVEGDHIDRCQIFDESDLDAALARFDELQPCAPRLENAASHVVEQLQARFMARDWAALAEALADDICTDDRRRVVNAGVRHGRDAEMAALHAAASVGTTKVTSTFIGIRGQRLVLAKTRLSAQDQRSTAFNAEMLGVVEIEADDRVTAVVVFDTDDIDAAFAELDARYIAGEAAAHAHTWSVIAGSYATLSRRELPSASPEWLNIEDRRRVAMVEPVDRAALLRTAWDITPDFRIYIEAVHRLCREGAVVTRATNAATREGFAAEWRAIDTLTVDGDLITRCEISDETDIDDALARFDRMQLPGPRVARTGTRAEERCRRYFAAFAARDWKTVEDMSSDNFFIDDRRRVVDGGVRHGRDAEIKDLRAAAETGLTLTVLGVIATRGERFILARLRASGDERDVAWIESDPLLVAELDAAELLTAAVVFDIEDEDAAFAELDARYLAGEAAAHAQTWSLIAAAYASINRHELPRTPPDWVIIDRRRGTPFAPSSGAYLSAIWDLTPDFSIRIEAVHRLSSLGAVVTHAARGTSPDGFDAEWHEIAVSTVNGDLVNRSELFDESDLDAALARFDELQPRPPRLENAASQVAERFLAYCAAGDWDALAQILADNFFQDDRRRVVGAGVRHGRAAAILDMRTLAGLDFTNVTTTVIATRGERLALIRTRFSFREAGPEAFFTEALGIAENNADNRIAAHVVFDVDDFDAALEELDARYLAGEAAAHAHTWSVILGAYTALNRRELAATTPDWVNIDHRHGTKFAPGEMAAYLHATSDVTTNASIYADSVRQLSEHGAVVTHVATATSNDGFDAEWRETAIFMVDGDLINRCELFDETDLDAALVRFDDLQPGPLRLQNAASQATERFLACFTTRDWAALAETMVNDYSAHDHRRVVNAGVLQGRDVNLANMQATAEVGFEGLTSTTIATRGQRLALLRIGSSVQGFEAAEMLGIIEVGADNRLTASELFDVDDIDAAFEKLDARYLAGEATAYPEAWSVIAGVSAGFNRHQLPATTPGIVYIDHRPLVTIEASELPASIRAVWELTPDIRSYLEAVHRLSGLGAVVTLTSRGSSHHDFDAEWRTIDIFTLDGELISRCEIFDEADLDAALARFDKLVALRSAPDTA